MPFPPRAAIVAAAYTVLCVKCDEPLPTVSGSQVWMLDELQRAEQHCRYAHCQCGQANRIEVPTKVDVA